MAFQRAWLSLICCWVVDVFCNLAVNVVSVSLSDFLLLLFIGYLFGSIPFGLIICYLFGAGDIRKIGSGNIGATNVLRSGKKSLAFATLLLDILKPFFAYAVALFLLLETNTVLKILNYASCPHFMIHSILGSAGVNFIWPIVPIGLCVTLGAVLGHCYPVWLKFKGGKGLATAIGGLLLSLPPVGLLVCLIWLITAFISKISSLAALTALGITQILAFLLIAIFPKTLSIVICYTILTLLVFWRHKENIQRLLKGEEPKIGAKK